MRRRILSLAVVLAACSGQREAGAIGQTLDLRQYLPDSLRSASTAAADSTFRQEIRVGPDSAQVELVWTTFQHDSGRFLSSVAARLIAPVRYDSLTLGNPSNLRNTGTKTRVIASANAQVGWFKRTFFVHRAGVMNFAVDAAGRRTIGPAASK
ncbi:MAG: hypothetical protein ACM3SX_15445 [Deltaproteobacteria bacterium]